MDDDEIEPDDIKLTPNAFQEYIAKKFDEFLIYEYWINGLICLRCDPAGLHAIMQNEVETPWCTFCGKDPLMHGPLRSDIPVKKRFLVSRQLFDIAVLLGFDPDDMEVAEVTKPKIRGLRPQLMTLDEIVDGWRK